MRDSTVHRRTKETDVTVTLELDGTGEADIDTGVGFLGRSYLVWHADIPRVSLGLFDTEMGEDFFRALSVQSGMTLHINVPYGRNTHHMLEAIFKGFGRALSEAVAIDPRVHGIMSSKGAL